MNGEIRNHIIPGTRCFVDWFRSAVLCEEKPLLGSEKVTRVLTHFHGDHYSGLNSDWDDGLILCSRVTARLLKDVMGVKPEFVRSLEIGVETDTGDCMITFVDANHCPGSIMVVVERKSDKKLFLHCGDMRFHPDMKSDPLLKSICSRVDIIFLDTTFAHEKHSFPTQEMIVDKAVGSIQPYKFDEEFIVLIGAYNIGKERFVLGVSKGLGIGTVYVTEKKKRMLDCLQLSEDDRAIFTNDPSARIHIVGMRSIGTLFPFFQPNFAAIRDYIAQLNRTHGTHFKRVVALLPTGWAGASNYNKKNSIRQDASGDICVRLIAYSEHSDFEGLQTFVSFLRPRQIVPTVYSDEKHRQKIVHRFRNCVDQMANKRAFIASFSKGAVAGKQPAVVDIANDSSDDDDVVFIGGETSGGGASWACSRCTFRHDDIKRTRCSMCDEPRQPLKLSSKIQQPVSKKRKALPSSSGTIVDFFGCKTKTRTVTPITVKPSSQKPASGVVKFDGEETNHTKDIMQVDLSTPTENFVLPDRDISNLEYGFLVGALSQVKATKKRLMKHNILVNAFRCALHWCSRKSPETVVQMVLLSLGRISNSHENVELSIGASQVSNAIRDSTGASRKQTNALYNEYGDLGDVPFFCKRRQNVLPFKSSKKQVISIKEVFDMLLALSKMSGQGVNSLREGRMVSMFRRCQGEEIRFLVGALLRDMRIGANEKSILDALVEGSLRNRGEVSEIPVELIKCRALFNVCPDYKTFVLALAKGGVAQVQKCVRMTPTTPVRPMLAEVGHNTVEFFQAFGGSGGFTCEFKYDGQRVQIHLHSDGNMDIFSRNCQSNSDKFPDVLETLRKCKGGNVKSFILDAEVVAVDPSKPDIILPFQTLATRSRKNASANEVDVCVFAFDLIYLNEQSLLPRPLSERRSLLLEHFTLVPSRFSMVESLDFVSHHKGHVSEVHEKQVNKQVFDFMQKALNQGCEGLIGKALNSCYEPEKRSTQWMKLKQDYIMDQQNTETFTGGGLNDTLDLVPIGAWHGSGRKSKFWSPFLLACWNPERECFQALCKCMTGFSDKFYKAQNEYYSSSDKHGNPRILTGPQFDYESGLIPSVWFRSSQVWEVRGSELTISPTHVAAQGEIQGTEKGLSLRFPRFVRVREDKLPQDATTSTQLLRLFEKQTRSKT
uniref:DNA ligase n=1 Tax=Mucochytrium quahogii TaxID=96639 RepID=A0A7S2SCG2_9STRA|mmetsp:Transcript_18100/g.30822  ORF Transcript_18100/g.30822 Transcript_18100/m.30822 type:complete len:1168 (+) Transcript_18100:398-3901(+)|eukprot:CAMPEP_0203760602 /NCGR_PEP_ID=MMETSP0098-20131031/13857_1 /ASSEMBLY_ACC=CAM_ASM_000208 /TAXON_ID=96639 /ORGANISM=" , Strain NY0313808BC1" /LENGTH=1167 /DNA_ID=CAMNT_0050654237 /DNA_START=270 /DNA_END=3773 /DNA_ORIENTATION=-